jgi:hypothetical protein
VGQLIEQPIKSLFNGVSRQPDSVRRTSQVEEADNVVLSVVTGGFEKRAASRHVAELAGLDPASTYAIHSINRDPTEQYIVVLGSQIIRVFDANTGVQKTVNPMSADALSYLNQTPDNFSFVSVADYTFIVNRKKTVALLPATSGTITGNHEKFADLPDPGGSGQIFRITGEATSLDDYYVTWDSGTNSWIEIANPNGQNSFDPTTMPYTLKRETNGSFTFSQETWAPRRVGDANLVKAPGFVGRVIRDVIIYKDRLGFIADEGLFLSQVGDYFNFWPDKATEVLDSDPIDLVASTSQVTIMQWAVPFRSAVFVTAENAQFEVSQSDRLTQKTASIDLATSYRTSIKCRPVTMGDVLYFGSTDGNAGIVFEYFYEQESLSNTAADVTKHAGGYVPDDIIQFAVEPASGTLFTLSGNDRRRAYVYNAYWAGQEKQQSAWGRWDFGEDAVVNGITVLNHQLFIVVRRGSSFFLEKCKVTAGSDDTDLSFEVKLDRRVRLTGTYDAVTDRTTWQLPYPHNGNITAVLSGAWANRKGTKLSNLTYPTATTVRRSGNYASAAVYFGYPFMSNVRLSKQYLRSQDDTTIITGRLQLRHMTFAYRKSGYFEVHVTPFKRPTKVRKFTGRVIGSGNNVIGSVAIETAGAFRVPIKSKGDTVVIEIKSDNFLPFTIVSAEWTGFYNEVSRQEA